MKVFLFCNQVKDIWLIYAIYPNNNFVNIIDIMVLAVPFQH